MRRPQPGEGLLARIVPRTEGDRLGRLALSRPGLLARDTYVRDTLRSAGVPVCVTLAGGYAEDIRDTVDINVNTLRVFTSLERTDGGGRKA